MRRRVVDPEIAAQIDAVLSAPEDKRAALARPILVGVLSDLKRIADALETIAEKD